MDGRWIAGIIFVWGSVVLAYDLGGAARELAQAFAVLLAFSSFLVFGPAALANVLAYVAGSR